jgi:hypothetical protein
MSSTTTATTTVTAYSTAAPPAGKACTLRRRPRWSPHP